MNRAAGRALANPAYAFRPSQVIRRLRGGPNIDVVTLPWDARIKVDRRESVGSGIARTGVHELAVSETIWRLADAGDLAVDVGANVGYFTSLLAHRSRRVIALEAHPAIVERLRENARGWSGRIEIDPRAASDSSGVATIGEPEGFGSNAGTAGIGVQGTRTFEVETVPLDIVIGGEMVGVCKLDVEGHELAALRGMSDAMQARRVRDVIFEDHEPLPSPTSEYLVSVGYHLFSISQRFRRAELGPPEGRAPAWDAPTYLATLQPERALERMWKPGWHCLRAQRSSR